jgi:hypothetical protein
MNPSLLASAAPTARTRPSAHPLPTHQVPPHVTVVEAGVTLFAIAIAIAPTIAAATARTLAPDTAPAVYPVVVSRSSSRKLQYNFELAFAWRSGIDSLTWTR